MPDPNAPSAVDSAASAMQEQLRGIREAESLRFAAIELRQQALEARITAGVATLETAAANRFATARAWYERAIADLEKLFDVKLAALDKALGLQATEYERRLGLLNHEHARLDYDRKTYLRTDIYAKDEDRRLAEKIRREAQEDADRKERETESAANRRQAITSTVALAGSVLTLIVSIALHFFAPGTR